MKKALWTLSAGLIFLTGCFATREEMKTLREDVTTLQQQVTTLQQGMNNSTSKIKLGQADIGARMDEMEINTQKVAAQADENNAKLEKSNLRVDNLETSVSARLQALEAKAAAEIAVSSETMYDTAYTDYTKGNFDLAILGFRDYLQKFPAGTLADSAQYWIGESFFSQKKYDQAIGEFNRVINTYPQSNKIMYAKLKIAFSQALMGNKDLALKSLDEVIEKYPDTEAAKAALGKKKELQKKKE